MIRFGYWSFSKSFVMTSLNFQIWEIEMKMHLSSLNMPFRNSTKFEILWQVFWDITSKKDSCDHMTKGQIFSLKDILYRWTLHSSSSSFSGHFTTQTSMNLLHLVKTNSNRNFSSLSMSLNLCNQTWMARRWTIYFSRQFRAQRWDSFSAWSII